MEHDAREICQLVKALTFRDHSCFLPAPKYQKNKSGQTKGFFCLFWMMSLMQSTALT
uniref:Uncharacterized protein n=1 Tax=Meloidogyne incognita TaxID=6306 RepID=A0A914MWC6_MELIC